MSDGDTLRRTISPMQMVLCLLPVTDLLGSYTYTGNNMFIPEGEENQFCCDAPDRRMPSEGQRGHKIATLTADDCYRKKKNVYTSAERQRKRKVG